MRSLEETRLRSEDVGLSSVFHDNDDGSVTSMEMLKCGVVLRIKSLFRTNVLHHLGSNTLPGIVCKSVESMIIFCRFHLIVYFIRKEDKDYQSAVIGCIFDDVIPGLKNELTLFMKETKMAAKKQEEVDTINKKRSISKSKPIIISPPIIDSLNDKSTVTNLNKNNNDELVNEDNNNNNVDVDSEETSSDESIDESRGNDKKTNTNKDGDDEDSEDDSINRTSSDESIDESRGIVKKTKRNKDDDEEEDSSDECNVKLTEIMPLTIGTKSVYTQGIAISVHVDGKKYSNKTLQKKHCLLKRGSKRGVEIPYLINDVYINEDNDGYFYDISTTNELRKIFQIKIFV